MIETKIPLEDQIKAVEREIGMRLAVYPKLVAKAKMKQETADCELAAMQAVLASMRRYRTLRYGLKVLRASTDGARHYVDLPPGDSFNEAIDRLGIANGAS